MVHGHPQQGADNEESLRQLFDHELDSDSSGTGEPWGFVEQECPNRFLILEDQGGER